MSTATPPTPPAAPSLIGFSSVVSIQALCANGNELNALIKLLQDNGYGVRYASYREKFDDDGASSASLIFAKSNYAIPEPPKKTSKRAKPLHRKRAKKGKA